MRVDGLIYADDELIELIRKDQAPEQVANVAFLPGIQHASLAMPDIHWGYGFCIGGVAATDPDEGGVISPGGVGYDINCGVRLVRSNLHFDDVQPRSDEADGRALLPTIPAGVGQGGKYQFAAKELRQLMGEGVGFLEERGLATDARHRAHRSPRLPRPAPSPTTSASGPSTRGADQCGTLGSGNHFLEVQVVDQVFDEEAAQVMGLAKDMVCVMIHCGSRGLGYQVCDDALRSLRGAPAKYGIHLPDRQLVCAPIDSPEGAALPRRDVRRGQLRLVQSPAPDVAGPRSVREGLRSRLGAPAHGPGLRRGPQHRQVRGARGRRPEEAGLGPPQGATRAFPARPSRSARDVSRHRPAGDHSRRHGPRELGPRRPEPAAWSRPSAPPATAPAA